MKDKTCRKKSKKMILEKIQVSVAVEEPQVMVGTFAFDKIGPGGFVTLLKRYL